MWFSYDIEVYAHLPESINVGDYFLKLGMPFHQAFLLFRMIDWAQREGYLELRRREAEGLPLIDPNLVSIDKVQLPEDEELGDTEIII